MCCLRARVPPFGSGEPLHAALQPIGPQSHGQSPKLNASSLAPSEKYLVLTSSTCKPPANTFGPPDALRVLLSYTLPIPTPP